MTSTLTILDKLDRLTNFLFLVERKFSDNVDPSTSGIKSIKDLLRESLIMFVGLIERDEGYLSDDEIKRIADKINIAKEICCQCSLEEKIKNYKSLERDFVFLSDLFKDSLDVRTIILTKHDNEILKIKEKILLIKSESC